MDATSGTTSTQSATTQSTGGNSSTAASDYETFLLMLTTQLENQDPTSPADADELAVQLATFSGVEQQTYTNELLSDLIAQSSASGLAELGGWVGKEVLAGGPVTFEGSPIDLNVSLPSRADKAELVVTGADGVEVQRLPLDLNTTSISWAGTSSSGSPLPNAAYTFAIEATSLGQPVAGGTVNAYREVSEVWASGTDNLLLTAAGDAISVSDVVALRSGD